MNAKLTNNLQIVKLQFSFFCVNTFILPACKNYKLSFEVIVIIWRFKRKTNRTDCVTKFNAVICMNKNKFRLGWVGLGWVELDWVGLDWIGLSFVWLGLVWFVLVWFGLVWFERWHASLFGSLDNGGRGRGSHPKITLSCVRPKSIVLSAWSPHRGIDL